RSLVPRSSGGRWGVDRVTTGRSVGWWDVGTRRPVGRRVASMSQRVTRLVPEVREGAAAAPLERAFAKIRRVLEVPEEFPAEVLAAAEEAAGSPDLPERDLRDVGFLTIDPPGSMDLDQAMLLERAGDGWRVRYAIADVPAFVAPEGPLDQEVRR